MSALLTPPTVRRMREGEWRPKPNGESGPSLDDVVSRAWEVLRADVPAALPRLRRRADPAPVGRLRRRRRPLRVVRHLARVACRAT